VDAGPVLADTARLLYRLRFDVVLIGNAAPALQGAPVTAMDFDFLFRMTPTNLRRLKALARELGATVLRPYLPGLGPVSGDEGRQRPAAHFMGAIHGVRSFAGLKARAETIEMDGRRWSLLRWLTSSRARRRHGDRAIWRCSTSWRGHLKKQSARRRSGRTQARERPRADGAHSPSPFAAAGAAHGDSSEAPLLQRLRLMKAEAACD
jgi:hypothetical protein